MRGLPARCPRCGSSRVREVRLSVDEITGVCLACEAEVEPRELTREDASEALQIQLEQIRGRAVRHDAPTERRRESSPLDAVLPFIALGAGLLVLGLGLLGTQVLRPTRHLVEVPGARPDTPSESAVHPAPPPVPPELLERSEVEAHEPEAHPEVAPLPEPEDTAPEDTEPEDTGQPPGDDDIVLDTERIGTEL